VLSSGLHPHTPGLDLQRACGTSLEAAIAIGNKIALGQIDCGMAGGVDTISDPPVVYPRGYQQLLLASARGKTLGQRLSPWLGLRARHFKPVLPAVIEPRTGLSMGQSAELMARRWRIGREEQDRLAYESHVKAAAAWREGFYDDLVVPYRGLETDNNIRADTSLEKLAKLKPAFREGGSVTAGNSSSLNDGAAALLIASAEKAAQLGKRPLARIVASASAGVDPRFMGMGPVPATQKALQRAGLRVADLDLVELNEAFAAQALAVVSELKLDPERVNVDGGGIAIGHPLGMTGARILGHLAHALKRRGGRYGLATLCVGVGQGVSVVIESLR